MFDLKREKGASICNEEIRVLRVYLNVPKIFYFNTSCDLISLLHTHTHKSVHARALIYTNLRLLYTSITM